MAAKQEQEDWLAAMAAARRPLWNQQEEEEEEEDGTYVERVGQESLLILQELGENVRRHWWHYAGGTPLKPCELFGILVTRTRAVH
jgi:hypothetical protein